MDYLEAETNLFVEANRDELIRGGYDSTTSSKFCLTLPPDLGHCTWIHGGIENFNFPMHLLFDAFGPNSGIRSYCTIIKWVKFFLDVELYEMHV